ncbi:MAG: GspH/FimT family pseudopilin [Methylotenera sp.]|nr:GspH/FimT family pseudopilin [Methylotenera sp.]
MLIMKQSGPRGVTLIELAVVIALVALLLMAVIPSASAWIRNIQIRNVATSLQTGLQKARAEAMRRNTNVRFSLVSLTDSAVMDNSCKVDDDGVSWVVSLDDPEGKCATDVSDTTDPRILDKQATGSGGKWVKVQGYDGGTQTAKVVIFNGFGRPINNTGLARLDIENDTSGNDYRALRIAIGSGGTIRMCEPSVNASGDPRKC